MRNSTILAVCLAALALMMTVYAVLNGGDATSGKLSKRLAFDRREFIDESELSHKGIEAAYQRNAEIFEAALEAGEPEREARRAASREDFKLFRRNIILGSSNVLGLTCTMRMVDSHDFFRNSYAISDVRTGPSQVRSENAMDEYIRRYNQAIIKNKKTPFRDVCRVMNEGDSSAYISESFPYSSTRLFKTIKEDQVEAALPLSTESALPVYTLIDAARAGDEDKVRKLTSKSSVNRTDRFGMTALGWAIVRGHLNAVELLVESGADLEIQSGVSSRTPLMWAIYADRKEIFEYLLNAGADVNGSGSKLDDDEIEIRTRSSRKSLLERPVYTAAIRGSVYYLRTLHEAGAKIEYDHEVSALSWAILGGDLAAAKLLLELGADPNHETSLGYEYDEKHMSALVLAAESENIEAVKLLLAAGANINLVNNKGEGSALHMAIEARNLPLVELLLEHGADPNVGWKERAFQWTSPGKSVLQTAVFDDWDREYNPDILRKLIDAGANLDEVGDYEMDTALGQAAGWLLLEPLTTLIEAGADPNIPNEEKITPIMGAVSGHYQHCTVEMGEIVKALLAAGARVNERDDKGRTELFFMCAHVAGEELIAAGADIDAKDQLGRTAIFRAIPCLAGIADVEDQEDDEDMEEEETHKCRNRFNFLIKNGADLNIPDAWGITALDAAKHYGVLEYVENAVEAAQ
ncbi:MAG: hypothetical protein DHS20C05_14810 [Hyphococcus sp.]|nr:MAG: hypothetical protein DHS20C05_14810 [Marinicaulis sp.]